MKVFHKYRAVRTERHGLKFDSKAEAAYYDTLLLRKKAGEVVFFLRQVPFHLPGGVVYRCDFMVFHADGDVTVEDVKGFKTAQYESKKKIVEAIYPIEIKEITR